jgi:hypothetical protein
MRYKINSKTDNIMRPIHIYLAAFKTLSKNVFCMGFVIEKKTPSHFED